MSVTVTLTPVQARVIIDAVDLTNADPHSPLVQGVLALIMKLEQHEAAQAVVDRMVPPHLQTP